MYHKDCTTEIVELTRSVEWNEAVRLLNLIDWKNRAHEHSTLVKRDIIQRYRGKFDVLSESVDALRKMKGYLWSHLFAAVDNLGDDGYGDFCWHIVGLGTEEILRVTFNPDLARTRARAHDFVECMAYVLPYPEDLEQIDVNYHQDRATCALGTLAYLSEKRLPHDEEVVDDIRSRLVALIDGNIEEACGDFSKELYDKFYKWAGNQNSALYSNVLSDACVWLLGRNWKKW